MGLYNRDRFLRYISEADDDDENTYTMGSADDPDDDTDNNQDDTNQDNNVDNNTNDTQDDNTDTGYSMISADDPDDDTDNKVDFGNWARDNVKIRLDMSEWCELPCKNDTKSIKSTLIMARVIGEDLIYSRANSWTAWVGVNQWDNAMNNGKCYSDGLLVARDDFSDYYVAMRYYAMAHFSKYIPFR